MKSDPEQQTSAQARSIVRSLCELRDAESPASVLPAVLTRVGLADSYWRLESPIGPVFVAYSATGVSAVSRAGSAEEFERAFRSRTGRRAVRVQSPPPALAAAVEARLRGDARAQLEYDLRGVSEFERAVLLKALEIPRGEVRPYGWVAREIGRPKAVRAVGSALGQNPIPLLIPCHRVVRSDGRLGDYAFGAEAKRAVLEAEGAAPGVLEALARAGVRFYGDPTDGTYCLPSCGKMHLREDPRLVPLRSLAEAVAAGLRPCHECRPSALAS
jgi:O-6-methylguanine DNA methyltransferase